MISWFWLLWEKSASEVGFHQDIFLSFPAQSARNKGRVITCPQELPGKSQSCSYQCSSLSEICFCLRVHCIQSHQQVLAKCWAWFPVGLCKALQDNKCFGGTAPRSHFWPNSQKNVRQSAAAGERIQLRPSSSLLRAGPQRDGGSLKWCVQVASSCAVS